METLFILKISPYNNGYSIILNSILQGDSIVLIQDAVIGAKAAPTEFKEKLKKLREKDIPIYILKEDLLLRNIQNIEDGFKEITYKELAKLIVEHKRVVS